MIIRSTRAVAQIYLHFLSANLHGLGERLHERSDSHKAANNGGQIVSFSGICVKDKVGTVQFFIFTAWALMHFVGFKTLFIKTWIF
jgi:hypothetical protein